MKRLLGISAFGLNDCVALAGSVSCETGFYLANAVLPENPFGRIIVGKEAKDSRIHTGLNWPPEARIRTGEPLRRAPISYVWRALVEAGDRTARWNVGGGSYFPLSRILASHVVGLMTEPALVQPESQHGEKPKALQEKVAVVAIPNNLDEFGQEALLRELTHNEGCRETMLVWRPVAAALSWLDKVEGNFPPRMGENDHIHVVYLGADALEFTSFRLRMKKHNDYPYVLPLRDRPTSMPDLTAMDLVGRIIEESFQGIDAGAFWQAFTVFPELWEAIAGKDWHQEELPRAWSHAERWTIWNPSPDLFNQVYRFKATPCETLRELLRGSCPLSSNYAQPVEPLENKLRDQFDRMAGSFPGGKLRGMIFCGPLMQHEMPPWLRTQLDLFAQRGLSIEGSLNEPKAGRVWLCHDCEDPIADGAVIYGQRTIAGIPSYLDTMPQVSLLAQERAQYTWVPLLNAEEVPGGTEFRGSIKGKFVLEKRKRKLDVYLYKGSLEDATSETQNPLDTQVSRFPGITTCQARLIREVVRNLGSMKEVTGRGFFRSDTSAARYGMWFAQSIFADEIGEGVKSNGKPSSDHIIGPFRRAVFDFPSPPDNDVILDIEVRMRPAGGLAKVQILPNDPNFLRGERVHLNYSTMRAAASLPKIQRGWPRIQELVVHPEDTILLNGLRLVKLFEDTIPTGNNYKQVIDDVRDTLLKGTLPVFYKNLEVRVRAIDENGKSCTEEGENVIKRIGAKFESDFRQLNVSRKISLKDKVFSRATWLYASTPQIVCTYIKEILLQNFIQGRWNTAVEAASRAFTEVEDFRILFKSIGRRAKRSQQGSDSFPIQAARAVCRVLMLRKEGEKGLDSALAQVFAKRAVERLHDQQAKGNFNQLYFQLILLLLYLLRYRKTDPFCFDPKSPRSIEAFEQTMDSLAFAEKRLFKSGEFGKARRVKWIKEGFQSYIHYKGTGENLPKLIAGEAGDIA